ncbi:hypothetical protein [Chromobacterium haemolyticum]|uniref:Uncharacterized protein n=1 Tax=Chromobacterium haemolyticum TaxID=394935 RepID=A0A1W0D5Y6_9NEIS|nr:hypothetical protein [Chromobacterium haemolyticum]OQS42353.1 hypothetical protein B0T45_06075 [Chromobacterium haemolyticum]
MNWKLIVAGLVLAAVAWLGWDFSQRGAERDAAQAKAKQAQFVLAAKAKQDAVSAKVDASATATAQHTQVVYRTINKEVTKYVETHPASCTLPAGWVQLHNAAALGQLPDATGAAHDASGAASAAE